MSSSGKRKREILSIAEKLTILKKFDEKCSTHTLCSFARSVGLLESSLRKILRDREKVYTAATDGGSKRKKLKTGKYQELEEILTQWMSECRAKCIPLSGSILKTKALEIAEKLKVSNFCASNGWLERFKQRHGMSFRRQMLLDLSISKNALPPLTIM